MTMPTNAQLATQIQAILKRLGDVEARMKTQEDVGQSNLILLQKIENSLRIVRVGFSNSGKWIGTIATAAICAGISAVIYHLLASWH